MVAAQNQQQRGTAGEARQPAELPFSRFSLKQWGPGGSSGSLSGNVPECSGHSAEQSGGEELQEGSKASTSEDTNGEDAVRNVFFQLRGMHGGFESFQELHEGSDGHLQVRSTPMGSSHKLHCLRGRAQWQNNRRTASLTDNGVLLQ